MGIPALEDELFANLLTFDYLQVFRYFCKGKGKEKGRERKGKRFCHAQRVSKLIKIMFLAHFWGGHKSA